MKLGQRHEGFKLEMNPIEIDEVNVTKVDWQDIGIVTVAGTMLTAATVGIATYLTGTPIAEVVTPMIGYAAATVAGLSGLWHMNGGLKKTVTEYWVRYATIGWVEVTHDEYLEIEIHMGQLGDLDI